MKHWYIVKTKPGREAQAAALLTQGEFEIFYPRMRELVYRSGGKSFTLKSLFPSYLFVRADFGESRDFHMVKYTRGVSHVLCAGSLPLPVQPSVIAAIRSRADATGVVEVSSRFKEGQIVRVKKGMLKDLIGILEEPCSDEERVRVLLQLVNYRMRANLHVSELEAVRTPDSAAPLRRF